MNADEQMDDPHSIQDAINSYRKKIGEVLKLGDVHSGFTNIKHWDRS